MKVDRDKFMDQGYIILHNVIPPDKLEAMRASCDTILERQKVVWARDRKPDDPPGGLYETAKQPRAFMEYPGIIDEETANVIEDFWVADETLDTAKQLLCNPDPNVTQMMMMCNPVRDWPGGTGWHRDVHPVDMAPMGALAADFIENGPRYTQWNVPMYDDSVLWVVPGSHRRWNTEQENAEFLDDLKKPVTGGIPVELNAGDGVVYSNFLLHTGSNYTTKKRRTLHGGHAIFGNYPELVFTESLAPWARERFEDSTRQSERLKVITESTLRAVIDKNADAYRAGLESLQPGIGPSGKTVLTIYLSKAALHIRILKDPSFDVTESTRHRAMGSHPITLNWGAEFADRFTVKESETLWSRFEGLDAMLRDDVEMFEPAFQSGPMYYYFNELPDGVNTESFIASWADSPALKKGG
jgi:hypothetical protein